jgi:hypothetical protein
MSRRRRGIKEWWFLRERYINLRVRGNHLSLEDFAKQEEISPKTLERRAREDGWLLEIERRLEQQLAAVMEYQVAIIAALRQRLAEDGEVVNKLPSGIDN